MKEMVDALKQAFEKRLSSPIFGSLVFGFISANHKGLALFIIGDAGDRKKIISGYDVMNDWQSVLGYALVLYIMLNVCFPLIQNIVDWFLAHTIHKLKCKADQKRRESEIWSEREAIENSIKKKVENWEKEKIEFQASLDSVKLENSELKAQLETERAVTKAVDSISSQTKTAMQHIEGKAEMSIRDIKESTKDLYNKDLGHLQTILLDIKTRLLEGSEMCYAEIKER